MSMDKKYNEKKDDIFARIDKTPMYPQPVLHRLVNSSEKLNITLPQKDFFALFYPTMIVVLIVVVVFLFLILKMNTIMKIAMMLILLVLALGAIFVMLRIKMEIMTQMIYFDKRGKTYFYYEQNEHKRLKRSRISWKKIHALQVIKVNENHFEMILVTKEAKRLYLSGYIQKDNLFKDVEMVSQLVNIPIWMEGMEGLEMLK